MRNPGERTFLLLALLILIPACGVGGSGGTLTPTVAPAAPAQVKAVGGNGRVTLTWTSAGFGETITVSRSMTAGGPYFAISVPSGFLAPDTYVDRGLDNDTKYYYVVSASNPFGQSAPSAEVEGEPGFKPTSVVVGPASGCAMAMFEDGSVWAWGGNGSGELGTGDIVRADAPVEIPAPPGTIAIALGGGFSLFLLKDGTVWGVGDPLQGRLGDLPPDPPILTPVQIAGLSNIVALSAGAGHGLALKSDGTVWAWGLNLMGQVGNGTFGIVPVFAPYQIPSLSGVVAVSAGFNFSLALLDNGTVWAWGENTYGNCAIGTNDDRNPFPTQVLNLNGVARISAGGTHALALRNDGNVWGWGDAGVGQLGNGVTGGTFTKPVPVSTLTGVTAVAAGPDASLALRNDGTVWSWGDNAGIGLLGNNASTGIVNAPAKVSSLSAIKAIAAGGSHHLAMRDSGSMVAWGDNTQGQLGIGASDRSLSPVVVNNFTAPVSIAAGRSHSTAVRTGGTVWCWGGNQQGTMANGPISVTTTSMPVQSPEAALVNVSAVAAGQNHCIALKSGSVLTWGQNSNGQVGNGSVSVTGITVPFTVTLPASATAVDGGASHTLALLSTGDVYAWGMNISGQIGAGSITAYETSPKKVTVLGKAVAVSGGGFHSLALQTDPTVPVTGAVWSWGSNTSGQLGRSTVTPAVPAAIPGLVDCTAVAAGSTHSLVLKGGALLAWGSNFYGELGTGEGQPTSSPTPVPVPGLSDIVAVDAGDSYSLALRNDGTVWAWGKNDQGQLGDGTTATRKSPIQVPGLTHITRITCGATHNLAVDSDGLLWGWGQNDSEQVGKTLIKFSAVPVAINP